MTQLSDVRAFHVEVGQGAHSVPRVPSLEDVNRRHRIMGEEWKEIEAELTELRAVLRRGGRLPDVLAVYRRLLKELVDLHYTVLGTALELGLPFDEGFAEVHRSNMTKPVGQEPKCDAKGKVLKGPYYEAADMALVLPDAIDVTFVTAEEVKLDGVRIVAGKGVTFV